MLAINNIEVIYDHVILVLKGVSLDVPEGSTVRDAYTGATAQVTGGAVTLTPHANGVVLLEAAP